MAQHHGEQVPEVVSDAHRQPFERVDLWRHGEIMPTAGNRDHRRAAGVLTGPPELPLVQHPTLEPQDCPGTDTDGDRQQGQESHDERTACGRAPKDRPMGSTASPDRW